MITEYAIERRRKGMGIIESAYSAAQVRLRPILMTVLTMIFGMLPLMFASGAGANGNSSLGTGVVGGMAIGTLGLTFRCTSILHRFRVLTREDPQADGSRGRPTGIARARKERKRTRES